MFRNWFRLKQDIIHLFHPTQSSMSNRGFTVQTPTSPYSNHHASISIAPGYPRTHLQLRLLKHNLRLIMTSNITNHPITLPLHLAPQLRQTLPQMHNLTLHQQDRPYRRRPHIRAIQTPRHMPLVPESLARARHDSHGRADIEDERYSATV